MQNYFNYFTEIERFYQTRRETFTLLSTLDWVLIEGWKEQGIPLELVLKGIDRAFSKSKRRINSLAYCTRAVAEVVEEQKDLRLEAPPVPEVSADEVRAYVEKLALEVGRLAEKFPEFGGKFGGVAESIRGVDLKSLREAEQSLSAMEERVIALLKVACEEPVLVEVKRDVDGDLNPFRSTMTTEQLSMLEQQLWRRHLLERFEVPRLSLFYLL